MPLLTMTIGRETYMTTRYTILIVLTGMSLLGLTGCVERALTIRTQPDDAVIYLNDEEIGTSPTTVSFKWYGDYNVRIVKSGYQTLKTHQELVAPLHDYFPFDFVAQILWPGHIKDEYEWEFTLEPLQPLEREQLIQQAQALEDKLDQLTHDPNMMP